MSLKEFVIERAIQALLETLDKEAIQRAVNVAIKEGKSLVSSILDEARQAIVKSDNKIDDRVLLPIIEIIERTLNLPEGT